jgi:thioredoxin reductase (NADPH)
MKEPGEKSFDVIIIGGGPAGLSAAMWCDELGLSALLIEAGPEPGGQLLWTFNEIRNHLGVTAENGLEMRDIFTMQLKERNFAVRFGVPVLDADLGNKSVTLADGSRYLARAVVIATGVSRRKLGIPGEDRLADRGIIESGKRSQRAMKGKTVVIVGGGDAALENAVILSETASRVLVVHRRAEFSARPEFVTAAAARANTAFLTSMDLEEIGGEERVGFVILRDRINGGRQTLNADAVLIRIGVKPNTELFSGRIETDPAGYVKVGRDCRTSLDGIFAAGDVASPDAQTISTAAGMGATAAKLIYSYLQASK